MIYNINTKDTKIIKKIIEMHIGSITNWKQINKLKFTENASRNAFSALTTLIRLGFLVGLGFELKTFSASSKLFRYCKIVFIELCFLVFKTLARNYFLYFVFVIFFLYLYNKVCKH